MEGTVGRPLWTHPRPDTTRTNEFRVHIEKTYGEELPSYEHLRRWSCEHLDQFWQQVWHFTGVRASQPYAKVWQIARGIANPRREH